MMQSIILCDHVTERAVIGQYDLIVERDVTERSVIGQVLADFPASPLPLQP